MSTQHKLVMVPFRQATPPKRCGQTGAYYGAYDFTDCPECKEEACYHDGELTNGTGCEHLESDNGRVSYYRVPIKAAVPK